MATKKPLALYAAPNKVQEILATDTVDPASLGLTGSPVGTTDTQTLTNKTLTTPKIATIQDANGNTGAEIGGTASAVNYLKLGNTAAGAGSVDLEAKGADTDINVNLVPKGTGSVTIAGASLVTTTNTVTMTNKTLTEPLISDSATHNIQGGSVSGGVIKDGSGRAVIGTYGTGSGTYLTVRNNAVTGTSVISVVNVYTASSDANAGIRFRPKGTGTITVNRSDLGFATGSFVKMLDNADTIVSEDFRTLTAPPSSGLTVGAIAGGLVIPSGLTPAEPTQPIDQNRIYWYPFFAPRNGSTAVSVTGVRVCTGGANSASGNIRVGIWTNASGTSCYPNALVSGSEVIIAAPNTADTVVLSPAMTASLTPGALHWVGFCFENNLVEMFCHNVNTPRISVIGSSPAAPTGAGFFGTSETYTGWVATYTYGAFPADTGSLTAGMGYLTNVNVLDGGSTLTVGPNLMHQIIYGS